MDPDIQAEWRDLGFWYDYTSQTGWIIRGSRAGLIRFADRIEQYTQDESKRALSEHEHLGPHMYLEIVTWSSPEINSEGIFGTMDNLRDCARIIRQHAQGSVPGQHFDMSSYVPLGPDRMTITIEDDSFDPAQPDEER